ncbi:MAG: DamX protein [Motiliproteus sp.]|jgi:DamX protein
MNRQSPTTDNIDDLLGDSVPTLGIKSGSGECYLPASHIQLLEQIEHLSRYSHFIQIISGVNGSGKTTLLRQFYPNADDSAVHACDIQALPGMSAAQLLAELCQQLNIGTDPFGSASSQLQAVVEHAQLLNQLSRQMLIVIDDAHYLSLGALELLFNRLSTLADDEIRPHILLFAEPSIKRLTTAVSLSEIVETSCHFIDIPTLDSNALNSLLSHCFGAAAARLSDAQRQRVHTESLGLPGRVARVLEAISVDRPLKAQTVSPAIPSAMPPAMPSAMTSSSRILYIGVAVIAATLLLGSGVWLSLPAQLQSPPPQVADTSDRIRVQLSIKPKEKVKPATLTDADTEVTASSFEERLAQARAALEAEQQPLEQPRSEATSTQQLALAPVKAAPVVIPTDSPTYSPTDGPAATLSAGDPTATTLVLRLPQAADLQASQEPKSQARRYSGDSLTLMNWKPDGYTLQMLGARRQESVSDFIASMPESEKLLHFSTLYKTKPWFVVVYGNYANRAAAMTARGELPQELRARSPWARSVKGVQDDIRRLAP